LLPTGCGTQRTELSRRHQTATKVTGNNRKFVFTNWVPKYHGESRSTVEERGYELSDGDGTRKVIGEITKIEK